MRAVIRFLIAYVLCLSLNAATIVVNGPVIRGVAAGGSPADETFDTGSGYDLTWTQGGTIDTLNPDYTPAINGAESLRLVFTADSGYIYNTFTATNEKKVKFRFRRESNTGTCILAQWRAGTNGSVRGYMAVSGTGTIVARNGAADSSASSAAMSAATTYYCWFYYHQDEDGGAASGIARAAFSLTDSEPAYDGTNGVETLVGTATTTIGTFCLGVDTSETCEFIYDDIDYLP